MRRIAPVPLILALAMAATTAAAVEDIDARRDATVAEQERIARDLALSDEREARLAGEVAALSKDIAGVSAALIQAAKTENKLRDDVAVAAERLAAIDVRVDAVRASLAARSDVLAEVLAALQRMGLNPPPALLVRPEDALASVRSAILLGAVVPDLRLETDALLADLSELRSLADAERTERDKLASLALSQAEESRRLTMLLDARKALLQRSEAAIEEERHQQDLLAARATTLKDLLDNIDALVAARARARDAANLPAPGTLLSATPFAAMTGRLVLPVAGRLARRFGEMDGAGAHALGDTVQTQSGAIVTAPSDGTVLFSGPFRSYGQLLIVDAGGGYHVVLAGMANLSVSPGQSVLAGEPVGRMGETRLAGAAALSGDKQMPALYVEFRKDGKPVDPAPWWVARHSGRLGNDS